MRFSDFSLRSAPARLVLLTVCVLLSVLNRDAVAGEMRQPARKRTATLHHSPKPSPAPGSTPYLLVCLPPRLRFAEPVELFVPAPVLGPASVIDPFPPDDLAEEITALDQAASSTALTPAPAIPSTPPAAPDASAAASGSGPPAQSDISILPDDTPRAIRAEDVLVYFRFPAPSPTDGPPPRSSATYQQQ